MNSSRAARRFRVLLRALWVGVIFLGVVLAWRLHRVTWLQEPGAPAPHVEDRRQYHFRELTYSQTETLLQHWLRQAYAAKSPRERAVILARVAILQRERGLDAAAQAAAQEAVNLSKNDSEVRAVLSRSLRPEEIRP